MSSEEIILIALILITALLYSSVGHAGASGYLAALALMGVSPEVMRPTALSLNILVAVIATIKFYRIGAFSWSLFWPFALASMPFAYLGGMLTLPGEIYKPVVGVVLIYAAWRSFQSAQGSTECRVVPPKLPWLLLSGSTLGLLSGLTGVGGGIFLSPLLLLLHWAEVRVISGIAAAFILVNSIAGLLGVISSTPALPPMLPYWAVVAVIGGYIGAEYGSRRLGNQAILKLLSVVLIMGGVKMIVTA